MIIEQKNQDVHSFTEFNAFCKFVSLKNILLHCCKFKTQSDRARLFTLAGGTPARQGATTPPVASHGAYTVMGMFKR